MSIERDFRLYSCECDECGERLRTPAARNPKQATATLRHKGWRRTAHFANTYLWACPSCANCSPLATQEKSYGLQA